MPDELSDAERETLSTHRGGVGEILAGGEGLRDVARADVSDVLSKLAAATPDRIARLILLSELRRQTEAAFNELLYDIIAGRYQWTRSAHDPDDLRALAWQTHELSSLAAASGLHPSTMHKLVRRIAQETYDAARARFDAERATS